MISIPKERPKKDFRIEACEKIAMIEPDVKLRLLSQWINLKINAWPGPIHTFENHLIGYVMSILYWENFEKVKRFRNTCQYCETEFEQDANFKTRDHVIPTSRGGVDREHNRLPCCNPCNNWKGSSLPSEWLFELRHTISHRQKDGYNIRFYSRADIETIVKNLKTIVARDPERISYRALPVSKLKV